MEQERLVARDLPDAQEDVWRQEVQARVTGYRSRKGRRLEGAFSMRFPFPPTDEAAEEEQLLPEAEAVMPVAVVPPVFVADSPAVDLAPQPSVQSEDLFAAEASAPLPVDSVEPVAIVAPRPRSRRKVIAFPKPATVQDDEALSEHPRIFEVPEELRAGSTTPLLDGLHFHAREEAANAAVERLDLPLQPAGLTHRIRAGVVDCAIVFLSCTLFAGAGFKFLPKIAVSKPLLLTGAAIPFLLWGVYQYLFILYGGRTAGMRWVSIQLRSFKGEPASPRQRRARVFGLYFSAASLMMGLLWALVDVDALCWHDRISGTYLTSSN